MAPPHILFHMRRCPPPTHPLSNSDGLKCTLEIGSSDPFHHFPLPTPTHPLPQVSVCSSSSSPFRCTWEITSRDWEMESSPPRTRDSASCPIYSEVNYFHLDHFCRKGLLLRHSCPLTFNFSRRWSNKGKNGSSFINFCSFSFGPPIIIATQVVVNEV